MTDPGREQISTHEPPSGPIRIYVATTAGPVHIQRITREDPDVSSVVCLGGKALALPISSAYDAFVRDPTGVIQRRFGHGAYRIDVAATIDEGYSWQLALYLAHAADATCGLATDDDTEAPAYIVTGEVDRDLNILPVDHVAAKIAQIQADDPRFSQVTIIVPDANRDDLPEQESHGLNPVGTVAEALTIVRIQIPTLDRPAGNGQGPGAIAGNQTHEDIPAPIGKPLIEPPKRHGWRWAFAAVFLLAAGTALLGFSGPVPNWFDLYERGRIADLHRDLRQSQDLRARVAETLLEAVRPNPDQVVLRVDGSGDGLTFRSKGPDGVFLSGRGLRWIGTADKVSRPDHIVYLDPRPGDLSWQPEPLKASGDIVYRLIVLASPRPISGPQPWFPTLGGLGMPGRAGRRAAQVAARLNSAGVTVKVLEHRVRGK